MAVRAGHVFYYFLGRVCFEINLKSLPMVVFSPLLDFSLVNTCVSNSALILSRNNLCCLIYICLRTVNKCVFVLEAQKWVRKGRFSQSQCIPLSVPSQRFSIFLVLYFLPPDQCTSHVLL